MEDDLIQVYDRRMRKFNLTVIVAALIALAVFGHFLVAIFAMRPYLPSRIWRSLSDPPSRSKRT